MEFQDAIKIIEESPNYEQFAKLREVFEQRIANSQESDFTERGICYYYLIRINLKSHLMYETEQCRDNFDAMNKEFAKQLHKYKKDQKKFSKSEINDFFHLMERSYGSLETILRKKNFIEEGARAFEHKMEYRRHHFWFNGKIWRWFEYTLLKITSNYGDSFLRWGLTSLFFGLAMSVIYFLIDEFEPNMFLRIVPASEHWYNYFYFSIATLTSLGFGDYTPPTFWGKLVASAEVFFGFTMLGIFISLIQKKM